MKPENFLKLMTTRVEAMKEAKRKHVKVGVMDGQYDNGDTVASVAANHEYGNQHIPQRSFLRMPFVMHQDHINKVINGSFDLALQGDLSVDQALGRVGSAARDISKAAFRTNGFGTWAPLSEPYGSIKREQGGTLTLVDTTKLRESIKWKVSSN